LAFLINKNKEYLKCQVNLPPPPRDISDVNINGSAVLGECVKSAVLTQTTFMAGSAAWQMVKQVPHVKVGIQRAVLLGGCAFGAISEVIHEANDQINGNGGLKPPATPNCPKGYTCTPD